MFQPPMKISKTTKHVVFLFSILSLVSCKSLDLPSLNIKKEGLIGWGEKEPCIIDYCAFGNNVELTGEIKCRGGMSSKYNKHSFSLELNKKYSFPNLLNDDDWIINANYIDKTFMRHKISYDLFREMSPINKASKSTFIKVSVNDMYQGLYVLMEKTNASMLGLVKTDTMSMLFKDPPIFTKNKLTYVQDSLNYYHQKYPRISENDKTSHIEKFRNFLFYSSDTEFSKKIDKWIDLNNVIDWHIMLLFSNNGDGIVKNFYLYKLDKNTPFRFAIWDYDHSFGRDGDNEINLMERELNCNDAILLKRLSNISDIGYLRQLKKRWFELREQNIISFNNFKKHVKKNNLLIKREVKINAKKWPLDGVWYFDSSKYKQELDLMLNFVKLRIKQLDNSFNNLK